MNVKLYKLEKGNGLDETIEIGDRIYIPNDGITITVTQIIKVDVAWRMVWVTGIGSATLNG